MQRLLRFENDQENEHLRTNAMGDMSETYEIQREGRLRTLQVKYRSIVAHRPRGVVIFRLEQMVERG